MRLQAIGLCVGLVACSADNQNVQGLSGNYRVEFGGTFQVASEGSDTWSGTEYETFTDEAGQIGCDFRWKTNSASSPDVTVPWCTDCTDSWDVTCHSGEEVAGDCWTFMDVDAAAGAINFYLNFEETGQVVDGNQSGVVYIGVRDDAGIEWYPYADGVFDGERITYTDSYAL